jgi:hypothetical protein
MIAKTLFLVQIIHRILTQNLRGEKSLPEIMVDNRGILRIAGNSRAGLAAGNSRAGLAVGSS